MQPFTESGQSFMGAWDYLNADDLADLGGGGGTGVCGGFNGCDIAAEKSSDVSTADFFPAGKGDVGRFERCVTGFEQSTQAFAFDHSNCLLRHDELVFKS